LVLDQMGFPMASTDIERAEPNLPCRWVVQQTFAWLGCSRRLAKDWEKSIESATAFAQIASIGMPTRRIARHCKPA